MDALLDLFTALRSTVSKGLLEGEGLMGLYIRKHCLGFDQLEFDSVGRFWEAVKDYVDLAQGWQDETTVEATNQVHACDDDIRNEKGFGLVKEDRSNWPLSPQQVARKVWNMSQQQQQQQQYASPSNLHTTNTTFPPMASSTYLQIEDALQPLLEDHPELTIAHSLRYQNCTSHNERVGALEHFHRYFDYSLIQERKERLLYPPANAPGLGSTSTHNPVSGAHPSNPNAAGGNNAANPNGTNNNGGGNNASMTTPGTRVQYAAIVLASIHDSFQNGYLSHLATLEAVRVAQQSGDGACLAFALGWLAATRTTNTYNHGRPMGWQSAAQNISILLDRGLERAAEYQLRSLYASSSLWKARYWMQREQVGRSRTSFRRSGGDLSRFHRTAHSAWQSLSMASTGDSFLREGGGEGGVGGH